MRNWLINNTLHHVTHLRDVGNVALPPDSLTLKLMTISDLACFILEMTKSKLVGVFAGHRRIRTSLLIRSMPASAGLDNRIKIKERDWFETFRSSSPPCKVRSTENHNAEIVNRKSLEHETVDGYFNWSNLDYDNKTDTRYFA